MTHVTTQATRPPVVATASPFDPLVVTGGSRPSRVDGLLRLERMLASIPIASGAAESEREVSLDSRARDADEIARLTSALTVPTDPMLFLLAMGAKTSDIETRAEVGRASDASARASAHHRDAVAARKRASRAARRARRWLARAPRWVRRLITAITTIAGVAASAVTGGASLALSITAAALTLGASGVQKLAVKLGMNPEAARWLGVACAAVGSALSGGASAAAGATRVAADVSTVVTTINRVVQGVVAAGRVAQDVRGIGAGVHEHRGHLAMLDAAEHAMAGERATELVGEIAESMRDALATANDVRNRLLSVLEVERRREEATASALGR